MRKLNHLAILSALALAVATPAPLEADGFKPAVAAHRGACGYLPEHTLEAKALAYGMGPDFIEQDVVATKDNVLVVLHDHTLETTTDVAKKFPGRARKDGSYYAIDFTLDEIKSLVVTERFDPKTGQAVFSGRFPVGFDLDFRVPTLEEEIKMIQGLNKATGGDIGLYVEIKEPAFHEKEGKPIVGDTIKMLGQYGYNVKGANVILQIFDYDAVKKARELGWKADLAMLVDLEGQILRDDAKTHAWLMTEEGVKEVAKYATIYAPWFSYIAVPSEDGQSYSVPKPVLKWARDAGMKVHTWTYRSDALPGGFATEEAALDAIFKELKFDGLFTDFPDRVAAYLQKNGLR